MNRNRVSDLKGLSSLKKNILVLDCYFIYLLLLSGCVPQDQITQNTTPYEDQATVRSNSHKAVSRRSRWNSPNQKLDETTPIYQKYPIDFKRSVPEYMAEPPSNAFESGGVFQYVIIDSER